MPYSVEDILELGGQCGSGIAHLCRSSSRGIMVPVWPAIRCGIAVIHLTFLNLGPSRFSVAQALTNIDCVPLCFRQATHTLGRLFATTSPSFNSALRPSRNAGLILDARNSRRRYHARNPRSGQPLNHSFCKLALTRASHKGRPYPDSGSLTWVCPNLMQLFPKVIVERQEGFISLSRLVQTHWAIAAVSRQGKRMQFGLPTHASQGAPTAALQGQYALMSTPLKVRPEFRGRANAS